MDVPPILTFAKTAQEFIWSYAARITVNSSEGSRTRRDARGTSSFQFSKTYDRPHLVDQASGLPRLNFGTPHSLIADRRG